MPLQKTNQNLKLTEWSKYSFFFASQRNPLAIVASYLQIPQYYETGIFYFRTFE